MKKLKKLFVGVLLIGASACSIIDQSPEGMVFEETTQKNANRLKFESYVDFTSAMQELSETKSGINHLDIIKKYTSVPEGFVSLSNALESSSPNGNAQNPKASSFRLNSNAEIIDELVPDKAFASLLNSDLEIEVYGYIYKVTHFGTFFTKSENVEKLYSAIDDFDRDKLLENRTKNGRINDVNPPGGNDDEYLLDDGVYLVDTYYDFDYDEDLVVSSPAPISQNIILQPEYFCGACAPQTPTALPKAAYDTFDVHKFGAQTQVGKFFESFLGTNTGFTSNYSSNFRLKVKLYSFNYGVYKSVGINGKVQKKGWTGIWSKHSDSKAEKLVLGWDVMYFNVKIPFSMPINYTSFPSKIIGKEIMSFSNFSLTTSNVTDVSIPFLNKPLSSYNDLEKRMDKIVSTSLGKLAELVWKEAETSLASASYEIRSENIKSYRKIFPDKIKLMLSRYEQFETNSNEISLVIDRYFQISYSASGTAQFKTWHENILQPTLQNSKKMYEIEGASVFGAAIFQGQTKGIRIVKELE